MKSGRIWPLLAAAALSTTLFAQSSLSPEAQLKAAINREVVDGDDSGAIQQYKEIAEKYPSHRAVASQALLQLAELYDRQGNAEAQVTYRRIIEKYADSGVPATAARARLAAFQRAEAGPFNEHNLDKLFQGATLIAGSEDGKWAAYVKAIPGRFRTEIGATRVTGLYVADLATAQERLVVDPGERNERYVGPVFSPDGRRLAFTAIGTSSREYRITTIPSGEARTVESALGQESRYRWSPDGQFLAYGVRTNTTERFAIKVFSVATRESRSVGTSIAYWTEVLWSPDSRRLAFVAERPGGGLNLHIATLTSTEIRTLELPPVAVDGRIVLGGAKGWTTKDEIFFFFDRAGVGGDFFLIPAAGGTARKICEGRVPSGGDGCQGLVLGGQFQIARQNVDYGGRLTLRNTEDGKQTPFTIGSGVEQTVPGVGGASPDGKLLVFQSNRDGQWGLYVWPADRVPAKSPILVTPLASQASVLGGWWTRTGMIVQLDASQKPIYRFDVDPATGRATGPIERLTQDTLNHRQAVMSPDGRLIAYISEGSRSGLNVMETRGANERLVLERPPSQIEAIAWLNDQEVLCTDGPPAGSPRQIEVFTVNVKTSETKILPFKKANYVLTGFASGTGELFYLTNPDRELRAYSTRTGADRSVTTLDQNWNDMIVAADGRVIYTVAGRWYSDGRPVPEEIRLLGASGAPDRVLLKFADSGAMSVAPLDVSPDGKLLLYLDPNDNLFTLELDTLKSTHVTGEPEARYPWDARWSTDGRSIVFISRIDRRTWRRIDGVTYDGVTRLMGGKK